MYLHLGRDIAVLQDDIVGVFDLDTTSYSKRSKEFLVRAQKEKTVYNISDDLPKSFVLCAKAKNAASRRITKKKKRRDKDIVFISQISTATLLKRVEAGPLPENLL